MENLQKKEDEIVLQEKNTLLQAWSDFKDAIFNVLFVILDKNSEQQEEESLGGLIFQSGLDYLQIMAFPFNDLVINAWNGGDSLNALSSFFRKFNVSSYLPNAPYAAFLFMLYALIVIILLIIVDIIYVSYSFSKKKFKFTFPLVILAQIVPLFVTVLFLPITETLLSVVQCKLTDGAWQMVSFPNVTCWEGWHLFHATLTLLFVTIFVIISTIVALALFEPRMTTKKLTARQNSNGEVVFIVNKIVLQFFFSFSPFEGSAFYVTIIFLLSLWQFWSYTVKRPYYSKVADKFFKICSTYYFWTALMLMVGQLLQNYNFNGALLIWISGLPFFAIIIYFDGSIQSEGLQANNLKFKTGQQLDEHISEVLKLICSCKEDKNSAMLLIGYIEKHKEICNDTQCPLIVQKKKRKIDTMDHNCSQLLKQIQVMFIRGIKKFPECTKLRLSFAFFHLEQMRNKKKAFEEFTQSFNLDPSFEQQFNIYRFKKIIKENLQDRAQSQSDLVETIRLDNHLSLLEEAMVLSAKLHKAFWTELKEEKPDLKKLNLVGSQITEAGNAITQNYTEITKITTSNWEVLFSYAQYLILINGNTTQGKELLMNARKIFQDKQVDKSEDQVKMETDSLTHIANPMIVVSCSSAIEVPRILNSNLLFTEISGYQRGELFEKQLSLIAPKLFLASQTQFLCLSGQQKQCFIRHKFKHLVPVTYEVINKGDGQWHVVFKLLSDITTNILMLADMQGNITDFNLLGQDLAHDRPQHLNLNDLGITNWTSPLLRKPGGLPMKVKLAGKRGQCLVHADIVLGWTVREAETEEEESAMIVATQKEVGWKVMLSKGSKEVSVANQLDEQSSLLQKENELDDGVLQLYQNPNAMDIFISQLAETKHFQDSYVKFELKQKISTMRLMNNQIKMVYNQGNDNDYSEAGDRVLEEDDRESFKFDDETYQAKLRNAINTDLSHQQVANLRASSSVYVLVLFGLCIFQMVFQEQSVDQVKSYVAQINKRANEYHLLTSNLMAAVGQSSNYIEIYAQYQAKHMDFESDVQVTLTLENNLTATKYLNDAVIFLNSKIFSYFQEQRQQHTSTDTLISLLSNYFGKIYSAFVNHPQDLSVQTNFSFIVGAVILGITLLMMFFWIYILLTIDKKRYDIMIWFLDIPILYVSHLGNQCDIYLKQFVAIKELHQKGVPLDEDEDNIQEYSAKKNNNSNANDEEIEEQIKTRKSLISKNKKETLISKISLSELKVTWLLVYGLFFPALILALTQRFYNNFYFLQGQWIDTGTMIEVDSTLYLSIETVNRNLTLPFSLAPLFEDLRMQHKGSINDKHTQYLNERINSFSLTDIATIYNKVYFDNICSVSASSSDRAECESLVNGKLQSGYEVYSKYLVTPQPHLGPQIEKANRKYVVPALSQMLAIWQTSLSDQGRSLISLCTILLQVFIILSVLCYLVVWLYYLRKLNTELNQTIRMLNMIPFKLLPKSRKETKVFISWIIREANKTKHEEQ